MGATKQLLRYFRDIVRDVTKGTGIPVSLGIAPKGTLAKMASKFAKKYKAYNGVCLMNTEDKQKYMPCTFSMVKA